MQNAKLAASFALIVAPYESIKPIILFYVARNSGSPAAATTDVSWLWGEEGGLAEI